jgi:hypothetical protein
VATDGHTYERHAIEMWFEKHDVSPITGKIVAKNLIPNQALKKMIAGFNSKIIIIIFYRKMRGGNWKKMNK